MLATALRASGARYYRRLRGSLPATTIAVIRTPGREVDWTTLFRSAIEDSPKAVAFSDRFTFQYVNPAFLRLTGYTEAAEVSRKWLFEVLAKPEQSAGILQALQDKGSWKGRTHVRRSDSSRFLADVCARPITGSPGWIQWHFEDVSLATQTAQDHVRQLECVTLAGAGLAHDLANLLTVITGYSSMALNRPGEATPSRQLWSAILDTSQRASDITAQFLALCRHPSQSAQSVLPNAIIESVAPLLERLAGSGVALTTVLSADVGSVLIHPVELLQILMNLIVNARDAMPGGGAVSIETLRQTNGKQSFIVVSVRDTGMGMDTETKSRAFEAFFSSKPSDRGSGLGLTIVSSIVQKVGGHILVNTAPGDGTTFHIYLPETLLD